MATVFETRLIGNIGKDAEVKNMENGIVAINFPVAHNKNWKDKKSGDSKNQNDLGELYHLEKGRVKLKNY